MLSLIHLLATRACHGDTLKRALAGDDTACRLLAMLGIGSTHLDDMRRGSAERLAKAKPADIRTQAAFEYRLAEADEHVRVTEKRLLHAAEFENEVLTLLGVEYRNDVPDAIRTLQGRLAAAEEDGARSIDCMNEVEDLLGIKAEGREDVLDAIRGLRKRAKFAEASAQELRQRLQAEIMAHGTTRMLAESAEAAPKHDPVAALLALPDYVRVEVWPVGDSFNARAVRQADGAVSAMGNTPREALIALYNHITDRIKPKATKPPEPIVLGPWRERKIWWSEWSRQIVGKETGGLRVGAGGWAVLDYRDDRLHGGDEAGDKTDNENKAAADTWARENGYVLIDAEPGSLSGVLPKWRSTYGRYHEAVWGPGYVLIDDHAKGRMAHPRWEICVVAEDQRTAQTLAHGPQVGEEGKRCALAAAHALGLTGGGE